MNRCHVPLSVILLICFTGPGLFADPPALPSQPPALQRHAGSVKLEVKISGPGGPDLVLNDVTLANGDGELLPQARDAYIQMENTHYHIGRSGAVYTRATGPIQGPTKAMNCAGLTLYRLCKEKIVRCTEPLPLVNIPASDMAKVLARFATELKPNDERRPYDVVYWSDKPLEALSAHVGYVEQADGAEVEMMVTKDGAESTLWRRGDLTYDGDDLLFRRYTAARVYRMKPGVTLSWRYWLPEAVALTHDWISTEDPDQQYQVRSHSNPHKPPLWVFDRKNRIYAYIAFADGKHLYRTRWNAGQPPNGWMQCQGEYHKEGISWTNLIERIADPAQPAGFRTRPFQPTEWVRVVEGKVTYSGTWMHKYDLGGGKTEVRPLTGGQDGHDTAGNKLRLKVLKNVARVSVELSTGKVTGHMELGDELVTKDGENIGGMPINRIDLTGTRVDPMAFRSQKGLYYLRTKEDPRTKEGQQLYFSREAKVKVPAWPSLGDNFVVFGIEEAQFKSLVAGDLKNVPDYFCVMSTTGIQIPGEGTVKVPRRPVNRVEAIRALLAKGLPAIIVLTIEPAKIDGESATIVDGDTGRKEPLTVNRLVPPKSLIKTRDDDVMMTVLLPNPEDALGENEDAFIVTLGPNTTFDVGQYQRTLDALELFLQVGSTKTEHRDAGRAAAKIAVKFVTPTATIVKEGTTFIIDVDPGTGATHVKVLEGSVQITPKNVELEPFALAANQQSTITHASAEPPQPYKPTPSETAPVFTQPLPSTPAPTVAIGSGPRLPTEPEPGAALPAPTVINTLVHHQLTLENAIAGEAFPVLSGSGNRIVYFARPSQVMCIDFDGSSPHQVMETKNTPNELDISDDGSRVMVHHINRQIYTVSTAGGQPSTLAWTHDSEFVKARLSGDGRLVYFLLGRPAPLNGATERSPSGLYVVAADGGEPQLLVGHKQLRPVLGLPDNEGVAFSSSLDVSSDGGRIAFGVVAYSKTNAGPKVLVVDGNGRNLHLLVEGTKNSGGNVGQMAITPDGRLISYRLASWGKPMITGVIRADGSGDTVITRSNGPLRYPDGNIIGEPVTFTADGQWLHLGSTGRLIATDGSGRVYSLTATRGGAGKVLLNGGMLRGTMSHNAGRYAYLCQDERNSREMRQRVQVATLEVNPTDLRGAPRLSDINVAPSYLIPNKVGATVTTKVDSPQKLVRVSKVPLYKGRRDAGVSSEILYDDGETAGDKTAGDGVFTTNRLFAMDQAVMGPRIIRVDAESRGDDAQHHATAVDVAPIPVSAEPPPTPSEPMSEPPVTTPVEPVAATAPPAVHGMRIEAEHRRVSVGEQVIVPVWLKDATDVANINFEVHYDDTVAQPEGELIKGNMLAGAIFSANPRETGRMRIGFAQTNGLSGTGTVVQLPMRAIGNPGDITPLQLVVTTVDDPAGSALEIQRIDGSILIVGPDGQVPGDCDGDGRITAADAMCALKMSVGNMEINPRLDADGSGEVTSGDARVLLKQAVGIQ